MTRTILLKSSSKTKEASLELSAISFICTLQTLTYDPSSLQFYQPFLMHERHLCVAFPEK